MQFCYPYTSSLIPAKIDSILFASKMRLKTASTKWPNQVILFREKRNWDDEIYEMLKERRFEYEQLLNKYSDYTSGKDGCKFFNQYWWAGKGKSFNKLRKEMGFPNNYLYNLSCYRVHAGITGLLRFDNSEEGILIGACEEGKEFPMKFTLLNFAMSTKLFFNIFNIDSTKIIKKIDELLYSI